MTGGDSGDDSIRVFVRVRPPDPNLEGDLDHAHCVDVTSATSLGMQSRPEPKVFTFDHVAGMHTTQVLPVTHVACVAVLCTYCTYYMYIRVSLVCHVYSVLHLSQNLMKHSFINEALTCDYGS